MAAHCSLPSRHRLTLAALAGALVVAAMAWISFRVAIDSARPVAGAPAAATIYVDVADPTPDDGGCGDLANPCNTIQKGVTTAQPGDTVRVAEGIYHELVNISKDLHLLGANRNTTRIDAQELGRAVVIFGDSAVTISELTIQNGRSPEGGGVNINFSHLTLQSVDIALNTAITDGAGVYCGPGSTAVISDTRIFDNRVIGELGSGGGAYVAPDGRLSLVDSAVYGNTAGVGGGVQTGGTVTVTYSSLHGNTARAVGGGLSNDGSALVQHSAVRDNETSGADSDAGGIMNTGSITIHDSVVAGNTATRYGGGLDNESGAATVLNTTLEGNSSDIGGGIYNEPGALLTVTDTTLNGNSAEVGGGLRNHSTAILTNVTVSGNDATGNGGGISNFIGTLTLLNATVTGNSADIDHTDGGDGGGVFRSDGIVRLKNTIVASNEDLSPTTQYPDCFGSFQSDGNNLVGDATGCTGFSGTTDDIVGSGAAPVDPELDPLADNGGQTHTHALRSGSPAVDTANNNGCPDADQRGANRPYDGDGSGGATCDIGAFELGPTVATVTPTPTATSTLTPSATITPTETLTPSPTVTVSVTPEETLTPSPTSTRLPTVGPTPTPTLGPSPTATQPPPPTATVTAVPPTASHTPIVPTSTATPVPPTDAATTTVEPSTPVPTDVPSAVPTASVTTSPTLTPSPEPPPGPIHLPFAER